MIIGFDAKRAFQNTRGLGNYSRNLIEGLIAYAPNNRYILFGTPPNKGELEMWANEISKNATTIGSKSKNKIGMALWRSWGVASEIEMNKIDIYHGLSHEIPLKKSKTKYLVTIHDLLFLRFKEYFSPFDIQIYKSKIKHSCTNSDLILTVSEQTKTDLINFLNIPEEKIVVNYQSCSPLYYEPEPEWKLKLITTKYSLPNNYYLFVGALVKHKNLENIIEAISMLPLELMLPLVIVGRKNDYQKELLNVAKKFGVDKLLIFIDYVEATDMPSIYQLAKLLLWPSKFEGFGIPIIEALFSKLPVITSNVGCFSEVGGEHSCYVDPNNTLEISNAISDVMSSDTKYFEMQQFGYEYVQKFHIRNTTSELLKLYSQVSKIG